MQDFQNVKLSRAFSAIQAQTQALGFALSSEPLVDSLLRTLAATKP